MSSLTSASRHSPRSPFFLERTRIEHIWPYAPLKTAWVPYFADERDVTLFLDQSATHQPKLNTTTTTENFQSRVVDYISMISTDFDGRESRIPTIFDQNMNIY